jgi:hypothetical protein
VDGMTTVYACLTINNFYIAILGPVKVDGQGSRYFVHADIANITALSRMLILRADKCKLAPNSHEAGVIYILHWTVALRKVWL